MSIEVTKLPSGLTVATDSMPTATVSLGAWIGAGTRHEAAELNGIAHLLEHMAFKCRRSGGRRRPRSLRRRTSPKRSRPSAAT